MLANKTSRSKLKSTEKDFANAEKLTKAKRTYKSPKITPLIKPFDSPFTAMQAPATTLIVFIAKLIGEINFSSSENHFSDKANKMIKAKDTSIETIKPFKKLTKTFEFSAFDFDFV